MGYAGVWATENTREAIFNATMRKEVNSTTGPRMTVRFFGGWDYTAEDAERHNFAEIGYSKGVPMGRDLASAPGDQKGPVKGPLSYDSVQIPRIDCAGID